MRWEALRHVCMLIAMTEREICQWKRQRGKMLEPCSRAEEAGARTQVQGEAGRGQG